MTETIINAFDIWADAQGIKSKGRIKSINNISLDGIARLRELILEFAIHGKLVPQESKDEPASETFRKTTEEIESLAREDKPKKRKLLPKIKKHEHPCILPDGWIFVRLNDIGEWGSGSTPNRGNIEYYGGGIPWFKSGELVGDYIDSSEESVTELALKETSLRYNNVGDVLVAMYGATIGKTSILKVRATTNQAVCACTPFRCITNLYLLTILKAYKKRFAQMSAGGAQPNISREKIIATVIALPPVTEQHRIVNKVEELMVLCNKIEQEKTASLKTHQALVAAFLQTLTAAKSTSETKAAWMSLAPHFNILFCTEDSIEQLKQTILQLAVRGKLDTQDTNDEPACVLLKKIREENERQMRDGKMKQEKQLPIIRDEEKLYPLPKGWEWVRLKQIIRISSGDSLTSANMNSEGDVPVYGGNGVNGWHDKLNVTKPTLVIGRVGFYCGSIHVTPSSAWVTDNAFITHFSDTNIDLYFLSWLLKGTNLKENDSATAQPVISGRKIYPIVVGLPPLAEQHRIVAKIDELMYLCRQLQEQISNALQIQNTLSRVVVGQLIQ